jgi:nitrogen fixation/metabolism regulation signal transduction histidine kinase
MLRNIKWKQQQTPPIWIWFVAFTVSLLGIFILGMNPEYLDEYWKYLAGYNIVVICIAIFYLTRLFIALRHNNKQRIAGAKFSISLARIIPILTIIPVLSFYSFSFKTVQDNLEIATENLQHFNTKVVDETGGVYQDLKMYQAQHYIDQSTKIIKIISNLLNHTQLDEILNQLVIDDICKIEVFADNTLLANSNTSDNCETWEGYQLTNNLYYIDDTTSNNTILTQLPLQSIINTEKNIILSVFYKKKLHFDTIVHRVANFQKGIKNASITLNSSIIQRQFLIDFSTTIVLTLISILIIVLKMLEKIMIPLNKLSIASRNISQGTYEKINYNQTDNDITELINEFNAMSLQIKRSKRDIDNKNIYLETIIKYSSGIIAFNKDYTISLYNDKALHLLNITQSLTNKNIDNITTYNPQLKTLITHFKTFNTINEHIEIAGKLLDITGVELKDVHNIGYILVIKDISTIIKTQKLQAWNEVARRMAHEIKNPLNPILLSAQRLRNKYLADENTQHEVIDKTTKTIISQVESISLMVSSFAEYGKSPNLQLTPYNLNDIITSAASLYDEEYNITLNLEQLPILPLDKNSMGRVLINLIKNSIEAQTENNLQIIINTFMRDNTVVLEIIDNGKGFDVAIVDKVFEPYITSKTSGGGLGMAIIQKIITSHNGDITIDKHYQNGAKIIITFAIQ